MTIKPDDIHSPFTLEIDSNHIEPEVFLKATRAFYSLLSILTKEIKDTPVKWNLSVQKGSAGVACKPEPKQFSPSERAKLTKLFDQSLDCVQDRREFPENYPVEAIKALYAIAESSKVVPIGLWRNKQKTKLTQESYEHLSSLLDKYEDYGSVSGIIRVVSENRGKKITVVDRITGNNIQCMLEDKLLQEALQLFGKRVEVYGKIKFSSQGVPMTIQATGIIPINQTGEHVSLYKLKGILRAQDE